MRPAALFMVIVWGISFGGCATIPAEAPELSMKLGAQLSALEAAHLRLLDEFFTEKKRRVDEFVQETWVPQFAAEFFGDPRIDAVWRQVVQSADPQDRLKFITLVGPRLQEKINSKRVELVQPLEELEAAIARRLKFEYDNARAVNNTLTAFLSSASKVDENRKRFLDMLGVRDLEIDSYISATDEAVSQLTSAGKKVEERVNDAEHFKRKIKDIIANLRK